MVLAISHQDSHPAKVFYPEDDGLPMSQNTQQFQLRVEIKENSVHDPHVFVAGDLLWYPIEGNNQICTAPEVMVVLGRPKGDRCCYKQWEEANTPPQVVFEILSPSNRLLEMFRKLEFYQQYAVSEYYVYDPERMDLTGWQRASTRLVPIEAMQGWVSPLLGIKFQLEQGELAIYRPDGQKFSSFVQLSERADQQEQRAIRAELELQKARAKTERLAEKLRQLGIDPEALEA